MSKLILARFSDVDSADRAARALRSSPLARSIGRLAVSWEADGFNGDLVEAVAAPFGIAGYPAYYSGSAVTPFFNQYAPLPALTNDENDRPPEQSCEALMRLNCRDEAVKAVHGRLLSLGAYEIRVR